MHPHSPNFPTPPPPPPPGMGAATPGELEQLIGRWLEADKVRAREQWSASPAGQSYFWHARNNVPLPAPQAAPVQVVYVQHAPTTTVTKKTVRHGAHTAMDIATLGGWVPIHAGLALLFGRKTKTRTR